MNKKYPISFARAHTHTAISCHDCNLAEQCLPYGLEAAELAQLDQVIQHHSSLEKGDHIFFMRDPLQQVYAVKTGSLKTYQVTEAGEEQILGFYLPGELIGLDGFQDNYHHCSAVALESTSLCALPVHHLDQVRHRVPHLANILYRCMGKEIVKDQSVLMILAKHNADERVAAFLLNLSQRYQIRGFSALEFHLSMARHDIANYLGLAVETVSRVFSRFQDEGILTVSRKHIKINALARLKALLGE